MKEPTRAEIEDGVGNSRGTDLRGFLGGLGMVGLASLAASVQSAPVQAQAPASDGTLLPKKLSSIARLEVTREEMLEVSGGHEYFYEWTAQDNAGLSTIFFVHGTKIDAGEHYTVTTEITVKTFVKTEREKPISSDHQHVAIFGVKGPTTGSVRNDDVTMTTVHADGSTTREKRTVPVRLNLSEFAGNDFATMALSAGKRHLPGPG